jgi:hypothetical protein
MCTGRDLVASVARARLQDAKRLVSGGVLCVPGRACSGRSCVRGARVRRGCAAGAWAPAWVRGGGAWRRGRAACVGRVPSCGDSDACRRWLGERVRSWASWCLPAVRGRTCVGAWAGGASGGSFGAFAPVAIWTIAWLLRWGPVLCRKVTNGACYQGSQEFSASAVAYRPGSLADAQGPAAACPPRTPVCAVASYLPCMSRFHSI